MALKRFWGAFAAIFGLSLGLASTESAAQYKVVDLGVAVSASYSSAFEVNNLGQVIGYNGSYGGNSYFFWSSSTGLVNYTGLGVIKGLNNNGQVLVYDLTKYALWSPSSGSTVAITSGEGQRINTLNDSGGFAGAFGYDAAAWLGTPLSGATPTVIGPIGAYLSPGNEAVAINNAGAFVGNIYVGSHADRNDDKVHPFLWTAAQGFRDLGSLTSIDGDTVATEMSEAGAVVGYGSQRGTSRVRSFIWTQNAGMQDLGTPYPSTGMPWFDNNTSVMALDVNDSGTAIGFAQENYLSAPDAFIWSATTGNVKLDSQLTEAAREAGWHVSSAESINESGWIAGTAVFGGVSHAVLLVPVPEPATWALMLFGGFSLLSLRRKTFQQIAS